MDVSVGRLGIGLACRFESEVDAFRKDVPAREAAFRMYRLATRDSSPASDTPVHRTS